MKNNFISFFYISYNISLGQNGTMTSVAHKHFLTLVKGQRMKYIFMCKKNYKSVRREVYTVSLGELAIGQQFFFGHQPLKQIWPPNYERELHSL